MHLIILREVEIFGKYFYKFYLMSKLTHLINVPFCKGDERSGGVQKLQI